MCFFCFCFVYGRKRHAGGIQKVSKDILNQFQVEEADDPSTDMSSYHP